MRGCCRTSHFSLFAHPLGQEPHPDISLHVAQAQTALAELVRSGTGSAGSASGSSEEDSKSARIREALAALDRIATLVRAPSLHYRVVHIYAIALSVPMQVQFTGSL